MYVLNLVKYIKFISRYDWQWQREKKCKQDTNGQFFRTYETITQ